ncbi:MAG: ABC transporter ATP-binding protein [Roseiflexaceae bacterium]
MTLLEVRNLSAEFITPQGSAMRAVDGVSFALEAGQALGLVGESGCGKTTAMLAMLRLLPASGRIVSGEVLLDGEDLMALSTEELRQHRWRDMSIIFQGAMNALNPVRTIGSQLREAIILHRTVAREQAAKRAQELLELVGIPGWRSEQHPHQYSGGMRQRAMIAMALACNPKVIVADEPTTALDVMIQAQILDLLDRLRKELNLGLVIITHDLGVVAETCQQVLVMYGGRVAESGPVLQVFEQPSHPYTQRLLRAFPRIGDPDGKLSSIPGSPPRLSNLPSGCRFHPRCTIASERCRSELPELRLIRAAQRVACHHPEEANA